MQRTLLSATLLMCLSLTGCGESSAPDVSDNDIEAARPAAPDTSTPSEPASVQSEFSVSDIDRWKRGMEAEMQAVQAAAAKLANAADETEKIQAVSDASEANTLDAGAAAAGVDRDQYRRIRNKLSEAVSRLSPIEMEMNVSEMPPEVVEQMQAARAAAASQVQTQLPTDLFEALKAQAAELRELSKQLVAERIKVANAAR